MHFWKEECRRLVTYLESTRPLDLPCPDPIPGSVMPGRCATGEDVQGSRPALRQSRHPGGRASGPSHPPLRGEEAGRVEMPYDYYKLVGTVPADYASRPTRRATVEYSDRVDSQRSAWRPTARRLNVRTLLSIALRMGGMLIGELSRPVGGEAHWSADHELPVAGVGSATSSRPPWRGATMLEPILVSRGPARPASSEPKTLAQANP
jgi:hypothetical protein